MYRNALLLPLASLFAAHECGAQAYFYDSRHFEPAIVVKAGFGLGLMQALTDLGGHKGKHRPLFGDANKETIHQCSLFFGEWYLHKGWSLRLQYTRGIVSGADSLASSTDPYARLRNWRNLHFYSKISETTVLLKWFPGDLFPLAGTRRSLSGFFETGIGLFRFNPTASNEKEMVALALLHTEGLKLNDKKSGTSYPLTQTNIPLGLGLQLECNARWQLQLEFLYRLLFTDHLDDVSTTYPIKGELEKYLDRETSERAVYWSDRRLSHAEDPYYAFSTKRGNPARKDGYYTVTTQLLYVLNRKKR